MAGALAWFVQVLLLQALLPRQVQTPVPPPAAREGAPRLAVVLLAVAKTEEMATNTVILGAARPHTRPSAVRPVMALATVAVAAEVAATLTATPIVARIVLRIVRPTARDPADAEQPLIPSPS